MTKFYSPKFKQEMLHYVQPHPDRTLCSIAEEFDVSYSSLKTWVRNAKNSMPSSPSTTRALILIVHHSDKDQDKGARGSSAFRVALDIEFNVRRDDGAKALILSCTKMKDAEK